jgi:hypothetical protein
MASSPWEKEPWSFRSQDEPGRFIVAEAMLHAYFATAEKQ